MMRINLDILIEEGRKIQEGLTYVYPGYEIVRFYDVYSLSDTNQYYNWKECAIRFLRRYNEGVDVERFISYANEFEKDQHYLPAYISNMIGILEACNTIPSRGIAQLKQNDVIENDLSTLHDLEWGYLNFVHSAEDELNSFAAIEAFHKWHATASILFDKCFYSTDEDVIRFQDVDGSANGYVLKKEYDKIYTPYQKLVSRIKDRRNLKINMTQTDDSSFSKQEKSDKLNIFISYSHLDKKWLDRLEIHLKVLRRFFSQIEYWDDKKIKSGDKWKKEIEEAIKKSNVAILLVSTNYLASDFVATDEIPALLRKAEEDGTRIIPLIVSPCAFTFSELHVFQSINDPNKTLADISLDEAAVERVFLDLVVLPQFS